MIGSAEIQFLQPIGKSAGRWHEQSENEMNTERGQESQPQTYVDRSIRQCSSYIRTRRIAMHTSTYKYMLERIYASTASSHKAIENEL